MGNRLEILNANYWQNVNFEKELAMIYPVAHPKRKKMSTECNAILKQIHKLQHESQTEKES